MQRTYCCVICVIIRHTHRVYPHSLQNLVCISIDLASFCLGQCVSINCPCSCVNQSLPTWRHLTLWQQAGYLM